MAVDDDSHVEWQLFIDGPFSLEAIVADACAVSEQSFNTRPMKTDWGASGVTLWNAAILADVVDGHDYETDGVLDFANFRFMVDLEDHRRPGDGREARGFAKRLFDLLQSGGARRLLLVDDLQGFVRDFDVDRDERITSSSPSAPS